jgi:DNA-binding transcriptional regulator YiaG
MQVDIQAKSPQQVIVELERALGLSRDDMARALDVNVRTVERWRKGTSIPQREARAARRPADIARSAT